MQVPKPLNCPFCGETAALWSSYNPKYKRYFVQVKCDYCKAMSKSYCGTENPADNGWNTGECLAAVRAWNHRADDEEEYWVL